jgi:uncharacterized membrane protein YhaH (DUF805 family)
MDFVTYSGRIGRAKWWAVQVALLSAGLLGGILSYTNSEYANGVALVMLLFGVLFGLPAHVCRMHDLDKSGWYLLVSLVPLFGPIWLYSNLGFVKGSPLDNRYGPPSLRRVSAAPLEEGSLPQGVDPLQTRFNEVAEVHRPAPDPHKARISTSWLVASVIVLAALSAGLALMFADAKSQLASSTADWTHQLEASEIQSRASEDELDHLTVELQQIRDERNRLREELALASSQPQPQVHGSCSESPVRPSQADWYPWLVGLLQDRPDDTLVAVALDPQVSRNICIYWFSPDLVDTTS